MPLLTTSLQGCSQKERCCEAAPDISAKVPWRNAFQCLLLPPNGIFNTNADNRHYHCFPNDTGNSFSYIGTHYGLLLFTDRCFLATRAHKRLFLCTDRGLSRFGRVPGLLPGAFRGEKGWQTRSAAQEELWDFQMPEIQAFNFHKTDIAR